MKTRSKSRSGRRRAFAYVLAIILLAVFASLAVVYSAGANLSARTSSNYGSSLQARLAAEGGLSYMLNQLDGVRLPGTTSQGSFLSNLAPVLSDKFDGTVNLGGQTVGISGSDVVVPEVSAPEGGFVSRIAWSGTGAPTLTVTGSANGAAQRVRIGLSFEPRRPAVFDYGLASKGQVNISGHAKIIGVNYLAEASVLSATESCEHAIVLGGSVEVSGDLYTCGDGTQVSMTGSPTVAGSQDPNVIAAHVHIGMDTPDFPEIDITPVAALATNVLSDSNPHDDSYSNIRIAAGTNPTFNSNVVLNGAIYIEAPNTVTFNGHATVNGVIVADSAGNPMEDCQVNFMGNVSAYGVEALPDTEEFAAVKQQTGTFIAAAGFAVTFAGNVSVDNGSIAADQLTFTGNAEGVVHGSVIGLKDMPTYLGGSVEIYVDRSDVDQDPAGFVKSFALVPTPETYTELRGLD